MTDKLLDIYSDEIPAFLYEIADSPQMQRLRGIGMNCGCEYTSFPLFKSLEPYSRFIHSIGVGAIVWNFTHDAKQAIAGLLHDVASPAFAHVIDFMKGDYMNQESTEERTAGIIASSVQICEVLAIMGIALEQVSDYHLYPVADNDTPRLSSDRLEYSLGNILNYRLGSLEDVKRYYTNLIVAENEEGVSELSFTDAQTAREFALKALECGKVYVCDADRYAMQFLSEIVHSAIKRGLFSEELLYSTEKQVIAALTADNEGKQDWEAFCSMCETESLKQATGSLSVNADTDTDKPGGYAYPARKISAKKRFIDPYVAGKGRVSALFEDFHLALEEFKAYSFDYYVSAK